MTPDEQAVAVAELHVRIEFLRSEMERVAEMIRDHRRGW